MQVPNIRYGLVGYPLTHSFSKKYFTAKFEQLKINDQYELFPIENINEFPSLVAKHPNLAGLNVTIPYKQKIIPFLDNIDATAQHVGAVNTIKINHNTSSEKPVLTGYNTDVHGFKESIKPFLESNHTHALILGTGGAAQAVNFVLTEFGIKTFFVSGNKSGTAILSYAALNKNIIDTCKLIVNATPVGMYPNVSKCPEIPYEYLGEHHLLYDLIYNPEETLFLKMGKNNGCNTLNGNSMFYFQAEKAWEIWNSV